MEGGSANDYDYGNGDPVNQFDISGEGPCPPMLHRVRKDGSHYCKGNAAARLAGKVVKCAGHVVKGFVLPPPTVGGTLAESGTLVGVAGKAVFVTAKTYRIILPLSYVAAASGLVLIGSIAIVAGVAILISGC